VDDDDLEVLARQRLRAQRLEHRREALMAVVRRHDDRDPWLHDRGQ
jgi:hypothetical protein